MTKQCRGWKIIITAT